MYPLFESMITPDPKEGLLYESPFPGKSKNSLGKKSSKKGSDLKGL